MGAVYRARRADGAFEHDVAIKVVRHGFETPEALERFRLERQILARLTHAGIARLLDGGTTRDAHGVDTPYLVLEYVEGVSITAFCATHALSIADRLVLFRRVLDAAAHAHQRLIVHQDLKPANILVSVDGEPKLLDFGIATLITGTEVPALRTNVLALRSEGQAVRTSDGTESDTFGPPNQPPPRLRRSAEAQRAKAEGGPHDSGGAITADGATMLTPEYASPEQIRGEPITVATDVYALGAVLYELLTDRQAHRFETRSTAEINRVVCDLPVTRPSTLVAADAKRRRQLAGDLDTIVLKALHKDPARRYASVDQLSEDLRLHLAGLPVSARPDTPLYRIGKFVRRNKTLAAAMILAIVSLVGGLVVSLQQTRRANARFQDVRTLANRLLNEVEPAIRLVPGTTNAKHLVANISTEYLDRLRGDAGDDPELMLEIAEGYFNVGIVEGSIDNESFGRYDAALQANEQALTIANRLRESGRFDARLARLAAHAYLARGELLSVTPARSDAMQQYRQAIAAAERGLAESPGDPKLIGIITSAENRGGDLLMNIGRVGEAAAMFEDSLARSAQSRERMPTITTRARLAIALRESGSPDRALALFRACLEETQRALERAPFSTSGTHTLTLLQADIGLTLAGREGPSLGLTDEGLASYRDALASGQALTRASGDNPHSLLAWAEAAVGFGALAADVDPGAALATLTESTKRLAPLLRDNSISDARLLEARGRSALSHALTRVRRFEEARVHATAATATLQALLDGDRDSTAFADALLMARVHLGEARAGLGDRTGAEEALRQAAALGGQLTAATPDRPRARTLQAIAEARLAMFVDGR